MPGARWVFPSKRSISGLRIRPRLLKRPPSRSARPPKSVEEWLRSPSQGGRRARCAIAYSVRQRSRSALFALPLAFALVALRPASSGAEGDDPGAQTHFEAAQPYLAMPFYALRAVFVVPGAAVVEAANTIPWMLDRPAPGSVPHARPGSIWKATLAALADDWSESTPGR